MNARPRLVLRVAGAGIVTFVFLVSMSAQDRFPPTLPGRPPAANHASPNPGNATVNRAESVPQFPASSGRPAPSLPTTPRDAGPPVGNTSARFAAVTAIETKDFGIAPTAQLRGNPMHAPTPTQIAGGAVISTEALHALTQQQASPFIILDVLGGERGLPGAQNAQPAGNDGTFTDATQRDLGNYLKQATQGKPDVALIFYCQNTYCWRSYNAALRAIKLGYTRVYWYRGGIEAWTQAGLPTLARN